jgi:hypothetical protein
MQIYRALLVFLVTLSGAVVSETSLRGGEEDSSEETSINNRDLNGNPGGVPICRKKGSGYTPTNLPPIYRLPGDFVPSRPGYILDETCQAILYVETCPCFTAEELSGTVNYAQVEVDGERAICAPKTCIKQNDPNFVGIYTACSEGGCSGYCCGPATTPGAKTILSCDFRPDYGGVHVDNITPAQNEACQAIIINEMDWPRPFPDCVVNVNVDC